MANPLPTTADEANATCHNTVFIDTNLNTHLALIVSDSDTVFDLKKRIVVEHALCFPEIGKINVHALKVKRRGCFYYLSESMCVKSAFHEVKKCWFISVDASSVKDSVENDHENKNCLVAVPANSVVAQVGCFYDDQKQLLKGCSSSLLEDENDRQLILVGVDGGGKHVYGEIGNMGSHKRKREEKDTGKDEVCGIDNEGEKGSLENGIVNVQDKLFEGKAKETGYDKKREHRSKKKSRNVVEDHLVENTMQEHGEKGVELCQGEPMNEGNKNIADEHCINAVSDVCKRSDALFESKDGLAGVSNDQKNNSTKSKADRDAEDPLQLQAASKKKQKREKKRVDDTSVKECTTLIPNFTEETLVHRDGNDQQSVLGADGISGGGKYVSVEISNMASHKRNKEDQAIEKDEVHNTENEGQRGNLENDIGYGHGKVLEERAQETGCDKKKKKHKSKKKHRIAVEDLPLENTVQDLPLENTVQECSKSGAELCNDEQVHKGNEGIAYKDCTNATSDACKSSDSLSQKVVGLAGGSNEDKKTTFKDEDGDLECEMRNISSLHPAAKKKHKHEKEIGDENSVKEDRTLDPDYKKEKLEHPTNAEPLTEQKNKNSAHSLTEKMENAHVLSAIPSSGKRKGKNKLSKSAKEETSPATDVKGNDSRAIKVINFKDLNEETNAASVPEKHVPGLPPSDPCAGKGRPSDAVEESNDKSSSQGIKTSDVDLRNVERRCNASEQETSYSAERVKSSKDDDAISAGMRLDVLNQVPNDRDEDALASGDEFAAHHKEEREKLPDICHSTVQGKNGTLLVEEEYCMRCKEAKSKLAENSELVDGKKSSKKRKKTKKDKDSAIEEQLTSARKHAEVSLNGISLAEAPTCSDNSGSVIAKEERNMHSKKRIEIPEVDAGSVSVLATDQEINDVIQNVVESVNKITETFTETENVDGKSRKKSKKRRGSQTNNLPELQAENGDVFHKDHTKETDSSSKMLKGGNDSTVKNGTLATQLNSVSFGTSELPPQKLKVDDKAKTGDVDDAGSHIQAIQENNRINFHDSFVPSQINHETVTLGKVLTDRATGIEGGNGEILPKKRKKNVNVHPSPAVKKLDPSLNANQKEKPQPGVISSKALATSLNEGKPPHAGKSSKSLALCSNENQKGKPQPGRNSSKSLVPSSNEDQKERPQPGETSSIIEPASPFSNARDKPIKPSEVYRGGVSAVPSNKSGEPKSDPDKARKHDAAKLSIGGGHTKIDKEAATTSISSLESSKNSKTTYKSAQGHQSDKKHNNAYLKKATNAHSGEVVSSSLHSNRKIGALNETFKGDISRVSADEGKSDSSDATTRTSSDNSSSSYYSDGESSTDISSSQSGSSSLKRKGGGRKNSSKLLSSGMSLDAILRSSSRYKKAKITASQSQLDDTESQPVDFVPESQPIH